MNNNNNNNDKERDSEVVVMERKRIIPSGSAEIGKSIIALVCGTLVYYHCAFKNSPIVSLFSDVFIVLLCSLAILGLLFRQMNVQVPVDPLEWQISQDTANTIVACLANTVGAAESVLRVAATGHDKRLFFKVILCLYALSALGRLAFGITIAYAGLCLFCLYMFAECSQTISSGVAWFLGRRNDTSREQDTIM
ncbi:reticulon-like protein B22 [Cicer arietinum]|uniref:Reticulon-like protein B22 n=1 Tax=Cicer arietinum TaxID=3827 RepID=A0A1S2YNS6_CICAR|nr:reticulon-like protein B22 [Cicer arietinum]